MKLYSCKVRLGGQVVNEVRKDDATAAEIALLQTIHGEDAVLEIVETGDVDRTDAAERDRLLTALYDGAVISQVFGVSAIPLPKEVAGAAKAEPVIDEPVVRRRARKSDTDADATPELE